MIPTSYLVKTLYAERWGDPANPHAVDAPAAVPPTPPSGEPQFSLMTLFSTLRHRFVRRQLVMVTAATHP